jgi:hypothetical protein
MTEESLIHTHKEFNGIEVMIDYLDDTLRRLSVEFDAVQGTCLYLQIDTSANSIAVTLWHMGRLLDVFFTQHALGLPADEECWFRYGWHRKTGYDPRGIGREGWGSLNGYTPEEVLAMPRFSKVLVKDFIIQVYASVREYLQSTSMEDLIKPGAGFNGKFTRYQIISMALLDNVRHLGEIRLLESLWERSPSGKMFDKENPT